MFWPLIIIAALFIGASSSKPSVKALPAASKGIIFNCNYIEIKDVNKFISEMKKNIENYFQQNEINSIQQLDILNIVAYLIKIYNPTCYNKIQQRKLTSREKIVSGIFIAEIFKVLEVRLFGMEGNPNDPNYVLFVQKIDNSYPVIREWLQVGAEFENMESINDAFMKNLKYPVA